MDDHRQHVLALLEQSGCGLYPPPPGYSGFFERRTTEGFRLIDEHLPGIRAAPPTDLLTLARVAGYGQAMGSELCYQLRVATESLPAVGKCCGLLNLMLVFFDYVADEQPEGAREMRRTLSRRRIEAELAAETDPAVLATPPVRNALAAMVIRITLEFFSACRLLRGAESDGTAWAALRSSVLDAYDAEVETVESRSAGGRHLAGILQRKNEESAAMMASVVLLAPRARETQPGAIRQLLARVGSLFGLLDDIWDLEEDLEKGHANLLIARHNGSLSKSDRSPSPLARAGLVSEAIIELRENLDGLDASARGLVRDPERFSRELRCWLGAWLVPPTELAPAHLAVPIGPLDRALSSLAMLQRPDGAFMTEMATTASMADAVEVESPYLHSYVVQCLAAARGHRPEVGPILDRAGCYLQRTRESDGWWRFFGSAKVDPGPDVDDTAVALTALATISAPFNGELAGQARRWVDSIEPLRRTNGLFETWADQAANDADSGPDAAVNANLLLLTGLAGRPDAALAQYFSKTALNASYESMNRYAATPLALPFLISRCYHDGDVRVLAPGMDHLARFVLDRRDDDGGWGNALDTALALVCLLNAGWRGQEIAGAVAWLLERQDHGGGWASGALFRDFEPHYYGSRAFTTALCLESVSRLLNY